MISRRACLGTLAGLAFFSRRFTAATAVTVFKDPSCGCCGVWVEHLKKNGFEVQVKEVANSELRPMKTRYGIPPNVQTCHTALIDGYVVEGHVPAADIQRLLKERPKGIGLVVPGMPIGSPGMEGNPRESYSVLLIDTTGKTSVFQKH
jgi:hypothetical protein